MHTSPTLIKFGTDGWRAIIGDGYTFANLQRISRATAVWLKKNYGPEPIVVIGHDTRFMGHEFSEYSARVLASEGIHVIFAGTTAATPAISWATEAFGCDAGIAITASHNPPQYNGFKIKASYGGPASPEMIAEVEKEILPPDSTERRIPTFAELEAAGLITIRDVNGEYLNMLRTRLDVEAIRASGIRIAHDAMFGASRGMIAELVGADRVVALRDDWNPGFHGQAPEPIEKNLQALSKAVVQEGCAVGIANDGDADRVGMFDENGDYVDSHRLLALLVRYLHVDRRLSGDIVKTFSTTSMLDKMGKAYGLNVRTCPIGFKYIATYIMGGDVLVGGEESGGIAVKGHIPERDGIYIGLLITEMMVKRGKKLSELVLELFDEFGPHYHHRNDIHTTQQKKQEVLSRLESGGLERLNGSAVTEVQTLDGYKHFSENGWLLVRPSGTEPVLRIYSEAATPAEAARLVADAREQLGV